MQKQQATGSSENKKKNYVIETKSLTLRPYQRQYVQEYHRWFSTYPELLYLTGSEPLTLEQEIQNHRSWLEDTAKYTFIIFTKQCTICSKSPHQHMIGDVNLFFSPWIESNEAEINIMIATPQFRGKGYAKQVLEAVQLFAYGVYHRDTIIAKIKMDNVASIKLFEKVGYVHIQDLESFQEKQYRKVVTQHEGEQKGDQGRAYQILLNRFKLHEVIDEKVLFSE